MHASAPDTSDATAVEAALRDLSDDDLADVPAALEGYLHPDSLPPLLALVAAEQQRRTAQPEGLAAVEKSPGELALDFDLGSACGEGRFFYVRKEPPRERVWRPLDLAVWLDEQIGPFAVQPDGDGLAVYDRTSGLYVGDAIKKAFGPALSRVVGNGLTRAMREQAIMQLRDMLILQGRVLPADLAHGERWVVCANGVLDWRTGVLHPHSPDRLMTVGIPAAWDPNADCPKVHATLLQIAGGDEELVNLFYCIFGAGMYSGRPSHQQAIVLSGAGRNGKGVIIDLMQWLVGTACTAIAPHDFEGNRFATAELAGALVNLAGDVDGTFTTTGKWKSIVAGEPVQVERKNGHPFKLSPIALHLVSYNNLPRTSDRSEGFFRRLLVLPLTQRFVNREPGVTLQPGQHWRDPDHFRRISALPGGIPNEAERSGLLRRSVEAFRAMMDPSGSRPGVFPEPPAVRAAMARYRDQADPVQAWLASGHVHLAALDVFETRAAAFRAFKSWMADEGHAFTGTGAVWADQLVDSLTGRHTVIDQIGPVRQACLFGLSLAPVCRVCLRRTPAGVDQHQTCTTPTLELNGADHE